MRRTVFLDPPRNCARFDCAGEGNARAQLCAQLCAKGKAWELRLGNYNLLKLISHVDIELSNGIIIRGRDSMSKAWGLSVEVGVYKASV